LTAGWTAQDGEGGDRVKPRKVALASALVGAPFVSLFNMANVFRILRFLLRLFTRRRPKGISQSTTAVVAVMASTPARTPEGNGAMNVGFDIHSEIRKLAERIVEPVASKLSSEVLGAVAGQIRDAFEQLLTQRTTPDTDFETMAANIVKPIQPMLTERNLRGSLTDFEVPWLGFVRVTGAKCSPRRNAPSLCKLARIRGFPAQADPIGVIARLDRATQ
jgi:hypothetical protein